MTADKLNRIRECAFDEDITHILEKVRQWFDGGADEALAACLEDIRNILEEETK